MTLRSIVASRAGPPLAVAAVACGLLLVAGVPAPSLALFAAYEIAFVLVPGVLLYRALGGGAGGALEQVAVGWPLGYLLEVLAFVLASATGAPLALCMSYPAVALGAALLTRRRVPSPTAAAGPRRAPPAAWAAAALCAVVLAYVGAGYFGQTPLPSGTASVGYEPDLLYDLSLAAEAKLRWPLGEPLVAGRPFGYHSFPYLDLAAASAVTGLELPLLLFRLQLPPMAALLVAQLVWAGSRLGGAGRIGVVAAAVALLLGELDLDPDRPWLFANYLGAAVWGPFNHGFVLGALFFVPALVLLGELAGPAPPARTRRHWVVLSLLVAGCAGAKGIALLPLLIGALALWLAWWALRRHELNRRAAAALGGIACLLAATYLVQYRGQARGTELAPMTTPSGMTAAELLGRALPGDGDAPAWLALGAFGTMPAVLIGCALVAIGREGRRSPGEAWLLSLLLAGLAPLFAFSHPGDSHLWPVAYAGLAGALLAAQGLVRLWDRLRERWDARALVIGGAAWLALIAAFVSASKIGGPTVSDARAAALAYASLASGLVALGVAWAWEAQRPRRAAAAALSALCLASALDAPLDVFPEYARRAGEPRAELPAGLLHGLWWIRDHTPSDAVVAASSSRLGTDPAPRYAHYSAFSERRVLVEGWALTGSAETVAPRVQLNRAIFEDADPGALAAAADDYGVTHLVVDKRAGGADPALARLAPLVFSNDDVEVHAVRRSTG